MKSNQTHSRTKGIQLTSERISPTRQPRLHQVTPKAENGAGDSDDERPYAEAQVALAEAARTEAEQVRRLAEEVRDDREQQRAAAEVFRQGQEGLREGAETARAAGEEARLAAQSARDAVVDSVRATAERQYSQMTTMDCPLLNSTGAPHDGQFATSTLI